MLNQIAAMMRRWGYDDRHILLNVFLPFAEVVEALYEDQEKNVGCFEFVADRRILGDKHYHVDEHDMLFVDELVCGSGQNESIVRTKPLSHAPTLVGLFNDPAARYILVCKIRN